MTWSLEATGHAIVEDVEGAAQAVEAEFVQELHKLLSDPRWGTLASRFAGSFVTSDVHVAPAAPEQPDTAATPAPETAPAADAAQTAQAETATAAAEPDTATNQAPAGDATAPQQE